MDRLTRRADYLAAARGVRVARRGFLLQARERADDGAARFGFTVTRRTGNAVVRNRIRRRLKEAVRLVGAEKGRPGFDYVLIGRPPALTMDFVELLADIQSAMAGTTQARGSGRGPKNGRPSPDQQQPMIAGISTGEAGSKHPFTDEPGPTTGPSPKRPSRERPDG